MVSLKRGVTVPPASSVPEWTSYDGSGGLGSFHRFEENRKRREERRREIEEKERSRKEKQEKQQEAYEKVQNKKGEWREALEKKWKEKRI